MTIAEACRQQTLGSRIRTLIVGAGVAGLSLAALLRRAGERPALIERAPSLGEGGYNLGLYPLGARILYGLGLMPRYLEISTPFRRYQMGNGHGELVHDFDLGGSLARYGPFQGIRRRELLDLLHSDAVASPVQFQATLVSLKNNGPEVEAVFSDGSSGAFDLVVGADGMHSETRKQLLEAKEFHYWDSGWGCWVAWLAAGLLPPATAIEYWGAGRLVGIYPVKDGLGAVLAGPKAAMRSEGREAFAAHVGEKFGMMTGPVAAVVDAVRNAPSPFFWDLHDCRCQRWSQGRVVLLGDAATGFLPTAGVGASMAMLAAATLADELARSGPAEVELALRFYEQRHRPRAEAAQDNSRKLARMMFVESTPLAWGRDQLIKFYTLDQALKEIVAIMESGA
ncbi:MAG TPA: NAD(P)/FAD-dependent oxidoreductase [Terriglobales bacterium]|nr:NAD(P)/FAD-dependent oxidoreductase [Terriglobales bacterium]